jgi:hypothetical protein
MATERDPVQLEEDDLQTLRTASAQVEEGLRTMSALARRTLGPEAYGSDEDAMPKLVIFAPGSSKQIHSNPPDGPCYVMIEPPGITRECNIEESTTCHEADELMKKLSR